MVNLVEWWRFFRAYRNGPIQALRKAKAIVAGKKVHPHPSYKV